MTKSNAGRPIDEDVSAMVELIDLLTEERNRLEEEKLHLKVENRQLSDSIKRVKWESTLGWSIFSILILCSAAFLIYRAITAKPTGVCYIEQPTQCLWRVKMNMDGSTDIVLGDVCSFSEAKDLAADNGCMLRDVNEKMPDQQKQ